MSPTNDPERERAEQIKAVAGALKDGQMPTTQQTVDGLESLKRETSQSVTTQNLSTDGKKVAADVERLLSTSQTVLKQNVAGNELQNAIYYAKQAAEKSDASTAKIGNKTQQQGNDAAQALLRAGTRAGELAQLIATSPEFRQMVTDIVNIAQEVLRQNVSNASSDLANDPNVPEKVRNAAANTRERADNTQVGGSLEDKSENLQQTGEEAKRSAYQAKEDAQNQLAEHADHAQKTANDAQRKAVNAGVDTKNDVGNALADGKNLRSAAHVLVDSVANQAESKLPAGFVDSTSNAIREHGAKLHTQETTPGDYSNDLKSKATGYKNLIQDQLQNADSQFRQSGTKVARQLTNLPKEKRNEVIAKIKTVIRAMQKKVEFQTAIDDIVLILKPLTSQVSDVTQFSLEKLAQAPTDPHELDGSRDARLAIANFKQFVENLANGTSLNGLIKAVAQFSEKAAQDPEIVELQNDVGSFLHRTTKEVGFIDKPNYEDEAGELIDRSRNQLDKYQYFTQNISYESSSFASALANNKSTQKLVQDGNALIADLFLDEKGNPTFKPELLRDMAKIIPVLAEKLAYMPIPRIEVDDGEYHMIFDNIVLHSTILPKFVHLVSDTTVDATKSDPNGQVNTFFLLEISKIEASARDIAWLFNKHSGFIKMGDVGLADFDIKGDGLGLKVKIRAGNQAGRVGDLQSDSGMKGQYIHAETVDASISNLSLKLHDSHHDILYKVLKPIIQRTAKKQIENSIAETVMNMFATLDDQIQKQMQTVAGVHAGAPPASKEQPQWASSAFNTAEE